MTRSQAKPLSLDDVKAKDLMQKDLVTLSTNDTIASAVKTLEEYHITGAPVVDSGGRLVGVLSVADIARGDHVQGGRLVSERHQYYLSNPLEEEVEDRLFGDEEILDKDDYSDSALDEQRVEDWMTPKVISVDPEASLLKICRLMTKESIHRVLVTEESTVLGLVSTFDVVRYLAGRA